MVCREWWNEEEDSYIRESCFHRYGVFNFYEKESATCFVFVYCWIDWVGRDCADREGFCAGVAAGAGVGAAAARVGDGNGRADDPPGTRACVSSEPGVG